MSITVPGQFDFLAANALLGNVPAGVEPLDSLLDRTNWFFENHAPPLVMFTPVVDKANSHTFIIACRPSQDADAYYAGSDPLEYTFYMSWWDASSFSCNLTIEASETSSSGPWTNVYGPSAEAGTAGDNTTVTTNFPMTSAGGSQFRYLKITLTGVAAQDIQPQCISIAPTGSTSGAPGGGATIYPSGFLAYDDSMLNGFSDAPIHTELVNRAWDNIRLVYQDRAQSLCSWVQESTTGGTRITTTGQVLTHYLFISPCSLVDLTTEVVVTARADDTGASGSITIGQLGGESVTFDADDADHSETITLTGRDPVLYATVSPDNTMDVRYVHIYMDPAFGGPDQIVQAAAPPARLAYLSAVDDIAVRGTFRQYAGQTVNFDYSLTASTDTYWHWHYHVAPGHWAGRLAISQARDGNEKTPGTYTELYTATSGAAGNDEIRIPPAIPGSYVYPPPPSTTVVYGSLLDQDTPLAPQNRMIELPPQRTSHIEALEGKRLVACTVTPLRVNDLTSLP